MPTETIRGSAGVTAIGLRELQRDLKAFSPEFAKRLQVIHKRLATEVAKAAQAKVYGARTGRHGPSGLSRARESIRANASQRESRVVAGGPKSPAFFGQEFGGSSGIAITSSRPTSTGRYLTRDTGPRGLKYGQRSLVARMAVRGRTRQFRPHLGRQGYFLWPAVREKLITVREDYERIAAEVMKGE